MMSRVYVSLAIASATVVVCAASGGRFIRSPRPPGIEATQLGEAKLAELAKVSSQISDSSESSFANSKGATASSPSEPAGVGIAANGPTGPPRDFNPSVGRGPSPPALTTGNLLETSSRNSISFPKGLSESSARNPASPLGPARTFDVDPVSSSILPANPSRRSNPQTLSSVPPRTSAIPSFPPMHNRGSAVLNSQQGAKISPNDRFSPRPLYEGTKETQFGDGSSRDVASYANHHTQGTNRISNASRNRQTVGFAPKNSGQKYSGANLSKQSDRVASKNDELEYSDEYVDDYDLDNQWVVVIPSRGASTVSYYWMQNGWSFYNGPFAPTFYYGTT